MKKDIRPGKEIFMPPTDTRRKLEQDLNCYSMTKLQTDLAPYFKFAQKYRLYYVDSTGKEIYSSAIDDIVSKDWITKYDCVQFCAIMRYHRNLKYFYDNLSVAEKRLMEKVFQKHYVSVEEASEILDEECYRTVGKITSYLSDEKLIPKLALWYDTEQLLNYGADYGRSYTPYLMFQKGLREELVSIMHPEYYIMKTVEDLPEDPSITSYDNEMGIPIIFPMLKVLFRTDQIEFGKSKCSATAIKKVAKTTNIMEFFSFGDGDTRRIAAHLLTNMFCLDADQNGIGDIATEDSIKHLLEAVNKEREFLPTLILSHITGFRKNEMHFCGSEEIGNNIQIALRLYAKDGNWLRAEDICHKVRTMDSHSERACMWLMSYEFEKMKLKNPYTDHIIHQADIIEEITYPFIKGYLFMMAVFGMVEVAYDQEPDDDITCPYDTLRYVRLTNLGKYALKLTQKYEKETEDAEASKLFELYEDNLMVKSLEEVNPYESVLNNMATHVSKHLYKVSYDTFLEGCSCKSDITHRICMFRDYVCQEPPAIWEQFFKDLEDRCKVLKAPKEKYSLLQIPSDRKDLQRIMLNDPVIRKYSLKAENFILLVETSKKDKVVEALKKYGYLL